MYLSLLCFFYYYETYYLPSNKNTQPAFRHKDDFLSLWGGWRVKVEVHCHASLLWLLIDREVSRRQLQEDESVVSQQTRSLACVRSKQSQLPEVFPHAPPPICGLRHSCLTQMMEGHLQCVQWVWLMQTEYGSQMAGPMEDWYLFIGKLSKSDLKEHSLSHVFVFHYAHGTNVQWQQSLVTMCHLTFV